MMKLIRSGWHFVLTWPDRSEPGVIPPRGTSGSQSSDRDDDDSLRFFRGYILMLPVALAFWVMVITLVSQWLRGR